MDKHINVVLASDDNYAQHVAVVTVSILKNTKFADQLHFFVLSDDISDKKIKLIKKTVEKFNAKIEFIGQAKKHLFKRTCKPSGVFQTDDC